MDVEQELNPALFPVQARFIVDNAHSETGNPDSVDSLRYYMGYYGYDPDRVTWSAAAVNVYVANDNCTDVYTDYARLINMDSIISAIGGGLIGWPNPSPPDNDPILACGGSTATMFQMQVSHTLPNIEDLHFYPCVLDPSTTRDPGGNPPYRYCYPNDAQANVQAEANIGFSDISHYLDLISTPSALFMVGETHTNSNNGSNLTCELQAPLDTAALTVTGYNQSSQAGRSVVFRPFINLPDASACFSPSNQNVNANNQGPYKPSEQ